LWFHAFLERKNQIPKVIYLKQNSTCEEAKLVNKTWGSPRFFKSYLEKNAKKKLVIQSCYKLLLGRACTESMRTNLPANVSVFLGFLQCTLSDMFLYNNITMKVMIFILVDQCTEKGVFNQQQITFLSFSGWEIICVKAYDNTIFVHQSAHICVYDNVNNSKHILIFRRYIWIYSRSILWFVEYWTKYPAKKYFCPNILRP